MNRQIIDQKNRLDILLSLVERGIIDMATEPCEIADMKKEAMLQEAFGRDELPISYYPSLGVYGIRIPVGLRREGVPTKVTGKTRDILIKKLFDMFIGKTDIRGGVTLTMLYEEFIAKRKEDEDFAAHTVRKNTCDWNTFFKDNALVQVPINIIQPSDIKDLFKQMTEGRKLTKHAFGNARGLLNQLFDLAYEKNLISRNICREVSIKDLKFRPEKCKQDLVYTKDERDRIVEHLAPSDNIYDKAVIMQFCLGCRVSEIKGLCWSDIDRDNKHVYIHREVVDGETGQILKDWTKSGQTEGNRVVPLTSRAESILATLIVPEDKETPVFLKDGKYLRTESVNTHLRDACRALGIEYLSSHKIRAWGITEALAAGMDQASVMRVAGHASPQTMRSYVRVARLQKDYSEKFESVFD